MRLSFSRTALLVLMALACSCSHLSEEVNGEWYYLGIPPNDEFPDSNYPLSEKVLVKHYWRVTRIRHVKQTELAQDEAAKEMKFVEKHAGTTYYSTEGIADIEQVKGIRTYKTILERKAYP